MFRYGLIIGVVDFFLVGKGHCNLVPVGGAREVEEDREKLKVEG